jgi:hypothetical protein
MGRCPSSTLQWSMPHLSRCWTPSLLQAHWERWRHSCLLWLTYSLREGLPSTPPVELSTQQPLLQAFPAPRLLGGGCHSCLLWPAYLFTVHVRSAPPPLSRAQCALPSLLLVFFFSAPCLLFSYIFFPLGRGQSVQGAMLICPREYCVPLICSPGGLPSRVEAGVWRRGSPSGFSV